ncbi:TPA: hypothetical protein JI044_17100 [Acinetobacter baumannii]|nr:hypothetical protein [Acinetobacter baumannii]HAV5300133.1 hypothetical protein [Acinetobacter baumannii]HAV5401033.1 hypothetical protein [Acinetobacter baumannii]HAV5548901.1 hypothetical protein [Acinetobacter baumannii]
MYPKLKAVRQSYDEYVLRFDSFPDLIFMGKNYFYDFFNEVESVKREIGDYWKIQSGPKLNDYEIFGCKVIVVDDRYFSFGFFEFTDLEETKDYIFDKDFRNSADLFSVDKGKKDLLDHRSWEPQPVERLPDLILNIPFFVIEAFKLEKISKKEIEDRKHNYKLRKEIYEPESRF